MIMIISSTILPLLLLYPLPVTSCHLTYWTVSPKSFFLSTITVSWHIQDNTCMDTVLVMVLGGRQDLIIPSPAYRGEVTMEVGERCGLYSVRLGLINNSSGQVSSKTGEYEDSIKPFQTNTTPIKIKTV